MSDYDYGNPRVRAMRSRLLSNDQLNNLAETGHLEGYISVLSQTPYKSALEAAMAIAEGIDGIQEALHIDMIETAKKIQGFYGGQAATYLKLWMLRVDLHNLKTILRGLSQSFMHAEIFPLLLPIGEIPVSILRQLIKTGNTREAVDLMVTLNLPCALPLLEVRAEHPGADNAALELALEKWYFRTVNETLAKVPKDSIDLKQALEMEADFFNLLTALRFAYHPEARQHAKEPIRDLFVGPGAISFDILEKVSQQDQLESAVELLVGSFYASPIQAGLEAFKRSRRLSEFEIYLRRFRLQWMADQIRKNPLGIGVLLGYAALKLNEISNLLWIAKGISLKMSSKQIKDNLEFAK